MMIENFNKLTPAEAERLACLIEECSEVIQAATKILRHGYVSFDPTNPDHCGNRLDLRTEIVDALAAMNDLFSAGDIPQANIYSDAISLELARKRQRYMHHQESENKN